MLAGVLHLLSAGGLTERRQYGKFNAFAVYLKILEESSVDVKRIQVRRLV